MDYFFHSIYFNGYKSFPSGKDQTISDIKYLTVFIGKNNCGKSSVVDVFEKLTNNKSGINVGQLEVGFIIEAEKCRKAFRNHECNNQDGLIISTYQMVKKHIGKELRAAVVPGEGFRNRYDGFKIDNCVAPHDIIWENLIKQYPESEYSYCLRRLNAERNICPENANPEIQLFEDGTGATNLLRAILSEDKYDESIIENDLKNALNEIMAPEARFERIQIQQNESKEWEIYLQENGQKRFPLSKSGSGLKTVLLVLLNLLVIPKLPLSKQFFFAFEELENNLHPALQRRLFSYIYDYAVKNKTYIFLTTHSHVAINMFYEKEHASLYHVVKENGESSIKKIDNYLDKVEILDDLDVKASDLLQANGIIWVEGPSDRIYIKKWLELFGGSDVQEGVDYQFSYYGGRILSHYSAEEEANLTEKINILLMNRNSAIVMDSDNRSKKDSINQTKSRIQREFESNKLFAWVTKGKEIENYISCSAINRQFGGQLKQCKQFELFPNYIKNEFPNFSSRKVEFANQIKGQIRDENVLDLKEKINELYQEIKKWNQ